jgi:hypothetical protein
MGKTRFVADGGMDATNRVHDNARLIDVNHVVAVLCHDQQTIS